MTARKPSGLWRWLKRIVLGFVGLVVLIIVGGAVYEQVARAQARHDFPPKGRLVDIGGRRMHLDCRGEGAPTVVLEAGLDSNGSLAWSAVHDKLAAVTRTCAYDRAGVMWSDPKKTPQNADAVADDLHATLAAARETGPFVMVGHSLGGPYLMSFTRKFGTEVAGVVFVDASHPDQAARFAAAGVPNPPPSDLPRILAGSTWLGWTRMIDMPPQPNVPAWMAAAVKAYASTSMAAAVAENEAFTQSALQAGKLRDLGDRPLVVLTADKPTADETLATIGETRAQADAQTRAWRALQDDEATWSTHSRHQVVADASHYIQFDRPDVVIAAVEEVVAAVRAKRRS
jgi:pimeloyl-ACP methyl ester carboxylesterase